MRKFLCIVSNIILTIVYIPMSWFASLLMWAAFDGYIENWTFSFDGIISFLFIALFFLTPVFSLLGIVISIVKWVKNRYLGAFLVQFLPFGTLALGFVLFLIWKI